MRKVSKREVARQRRRIDRLKAQRQKLLEAYYAEAISVDHLKSEQGRIARDLAGTAQELASAETAVTDVDEVLGQALT